MWRKKSGVKRIAKKIKVHPLSYGNHATVIRNVAIVRTLPSPFKLETRVHNTINESQTDAQHSFEII